ncbi:MAG TPA: hypothetical protein VFZ08_16400 [Terriglobia bacterium]|nr:hypothetical protein [Terriglobia bacterium]
MARSDVSGLKLRASFFKAKRLAEIMALAALTLTLPLAARGQIEGRIMNGTTNRPAAGQAVQLLTPGKGGIHQVATMHADAAGRFAFSGDEIKPNSFYLLQAVHGDVNYHHPVRLGAKASARADFKIYDSTTAAPPVHVSQARFLIRAKGDKVRVEELFALRNTTHPAVSYVNPNGTFHFNLAQGVGQPSVAVAGELNMPLPQDAQPGAKPGQYFIQYPLKPGLTVVMVEYQADYTSTGFTFADSVPYPIDQLELYVVPASLAVKSPVFQPAGTDSSTGGEKLTAENLKPGTTLQASLEGEIPGGTESASNEDQQVKELPNSMTRLGIPLMGCFLLVLLWAMGVRVSKEWSRKGAIRPGSAAQKEMEAKLETLLDSLTNLDELFEAGKVPEKKYWRERLDLKAKLVVMLKKSPPAFLDSYATRHNPRSV